MIIQLIFSLHLPKRIACVFNAVCEISLIIDSSSSFSSAEQVGDLSLEVTPHMCTGVQPEGRGLCCVWGQTRAQLLSVGFHLQQGAVCHCKCCVIARMSTSSFPPDSSPAVLLLSMPILGSPVLSSPSSFLLQVSLTSTISAPFSWSCSLLVPPASLPRSLPVGSSWDGDSSSSLH